MWNISVYADEIYEAQAGFEPALALLHRLGVKYTDLRVVNGYDHFMNLSDAQLDDLERLLKKYDCKVAGLGTPLFKCPLRGAHNPTWGAHHRANAGAAVSPTFEHYLAQLPRAFRLADRFGTENVRCFAFWREYPLGEVFEEIVEKLAHAADFAWKAGHRLYLENEHNTMAATGVEQARILRAVDSPALTGIYDDGNSARVGGVPWPDDYVALRGMIGHVHLKFEKLDVACGWPTAARQGLKLRTGYQPYFLWRQPTGPFEAEVQIGAKRFHLSGQRLLLTVANSVSGHQQPLLRALKRDGYKGFISIDNSSFEGLDRRLGRSNVAELEADVQAAVETLRQLIQEVTNADDRTEATA